MIDPPPGRPETAKPALVRTIFAGLAGGCAMNVAMLLTFRMLGFGWHGDGILIASPVQSPKLIAVWTEIEPLPLVVSAPAPIITGMVLLGVLHAVLFRWLYPVWSGGVIRQGLQFAGLVFMMTFLFWEFFTPFNLFGEPLPLIGLELVFWACTAAADGLTIAALIGKRIPTEHVRA